MKMLYSYLQGAVYSKERADVTAETCHELLKQGATFDDRNELPEVITPAGLSAQRQWYLHDKIREFCPVADRDVTCPVPKPTSRQGTPERPPSHTKRTRKQRICAQCKQPGHNVRTCSKWTIIPIKNHPFFLFNLLSLLSITHSYLLLTLIYY